MAHDVLVGHADAAVQLHGLLAHEAHGLAELHLGARERAAALVPRRAELEAGVVAHGAREFELHLHVGRAVAQGLEAGDGHAELPALVQVVEGHGAGLLHDAHGIGAGGGDAGVHGQLQRGQAVRGDERGRGMVQPHLGGAAAVLGAVAARGDAAGIALHEEQRDLAVQLGGHEEGVGLVACGDYAFGSCKRMPGGRFGRFCLADVEAVACLAFLVREHDERLAAGDARKPGGLHGIGGVLREHAGRYEGLRQRLQNDAAAQFLHGHHGVDGALAQAAVGLGHGQGRQAQTGQFAPGRAVEAARGHDGAAALEGVALVHPLAHGVAQGLLVVGKIEVHGLVSFRTLSPARFEPRCCAALRCCRRRWWSCAG